jgi:hypothetical protein
MHFDGMRPANEGENRGWHGAASSGVSSDVWDDPRVSPEKSHGERNSDGIGGHGGKRDDPRLGDGWAQRVICLSSSTTTMYLDTYTGCPGTTGRVPRLLHVDVQPTRRGFRLPSPPRRRRARSPDREPLSTTIRTSGVLRDSAAESESSESGTPLVYTSRTRALKLRRHPRVPSANGSRQEREKNGNGTPVDTRWK